MTGLVEASAAEGSRGQCWTQTASPRPVLLQLSSDSGYLLCVPVEWRRGSPESESQRASLPPPHPTIQYPFPLKLIPTTLSRPGGPAGQYDRGFQLGLQLLMLKPFHWAAGAVRSRVTTTRSTAGFGSAAYCLPPSPSPLITQHHNGQGLTNTLGFVRRDTSQWGLEMGVEMLRKQHLLWGSCEPHMACVCRATWGQAEGQLRRDPSLWGALHSELLTTDS